MDAENRKLKSCFDMVSLQMLPITGRNLVTKPRKTHPPKNGHNAATLDLIVK